jgi:hypothetical protein
MTGPDFPARTIGAACANRKSLWTDRSPKFESSRPEDAESVGGVLWTGLTDKKAQGKPEEQKGVIVDRVTRLATRDGGDGSAVAAAVRAVLDEYLPGR